MIRFFANVKKKAKECSRETAIENYLFTVKMALLICVAAEIFLVRIPVQGAEKPVIVESYTSEWGISVYVKNAADKEIENVQIGTGSCSYERTGTLSEIQQEVRTLILLDNSKSVPKESRTRISEMLQNLISDRASNEKIALATFSKQVSYLTDYTSDYAVLKKAIENISYQKTATYFTDVLYSVISEMQDSKTDECFNRILIISDGMDSETIGYTSEELYSLIKECSIPVYTVGVETEDNGVLLENMFALSRATGAESFLLDEMEDLLELNETLNEDRNVIRLDVIPDAELMDGSMKVVNITFASGESATMEIRMPQATESEQEKTSTQLTEEKTNDGEDFRIIFAGIGCVAAALGVTAIVLIVRRKGKTENCFEMISEEELKQKEKREAAPDATEYMSVPKRNTGEETVLLWNARKETMLILVDVHDTNKQFRLPLRDSVTIGRKSMCDVVIGYDQSVSGKHCKIMKRQGKYYIEDTGSSNGTYVDGVRISAEKEIHSGTLIKLGRVEMRAQIQ